MIRRPPPASTAHFVHGDTGLFADCPDCNGRDFLVDETGLVSFACLECGSQWHYHLGYVWRLYPDEHASERRS